MAQTKVLDLRFKTAAGKEAVISVTDPKDGLTLAEATAAMDVILAQDVFIIYGSKLTEKVNAAIRINEKVILA